MIPFVGTDAFILPFFFIILSLLLAHFLKFKNWFGKPFELTHILLAAPALLLLLVIGIGTGMVTEQFGLHDTEHVDETIDTIASEPVSGTTMLVASALGEELFFRGILYTLVGWVSIPLFALVHAGYDSLTQIIAALLGGIVFHITRQKTNSIYPGLIAHFLYNLLAVFFIHV